MHNNIISQELLSAYHQLQSREKKIQTRKKKLRTRLIQLREKGARVEPGKFDLRMTEKEMLRLSWPKVAAVLDQEVCDYLREEIAPTRSIYVSVVERSTVANNTKAKNAITFKNW